MDQHLSRCSSIFSPLKRTGIATPAKFISVAWTKRDERSERNLKMFTLCCLFFGEEIKNDEESERKKRAFVCLAD